MFKIKVNSLLVNIHPKTCMTRHKGINKCTRNTLEATVILDLVFFEDAFVNKPHCTLTALASN
jgi:hypothetical protein